MRLLGALLATVVALSSGISPESDTTTGANTDPTGWGVWAHSAGDEGDKTGGGVSGGDSPGEDDTIYGHNVHAVRCDAADYCPGAHGTIAPTPTPPAITQGTPGLDDVARFLVGNPTVRAEPEGWTLVGAETNFIASAGEREQTGQLLGQPVVVHFTPVAFDWNYGDGVDQTTSAPGASWAASGLPNFAKTVTSHVYLERGNYTVTVTVRFSARYEFAGQGWTDIPGTLGLTSDPITVTVKGVKTVLVGKDCLQNPAGPGC